MSTLKLSLYQKLLEPRGYNGIMEELDKGEEELRTEPWVLRQLESRKKKGVQQRRPGRGATEAEGKPGMWSLERQVKEFVAEDYSVW